MIDLFVCDIPWLRRLICMQLSCLIDFVTFDAFINDLLVRDLPWLRRLICMRLSCIIDFATFDAFIYF